LITSKIDPVLVIRAANVAAQWHAAQRRKGAHQEPYINHLLEVASLLAAANGDQETIIAALLHDSVEDQKISPETIAEQFGGNVAGIVLEVTDDKSLSRETRKAAQIGSAPAWDQPCHRSAHP
jgi:guanosine-3',5'-bis(diphosphate) 3'-pyrophosphohydrolase